MFLHFREAETIDRTGQPNAKGIGGGHGDPLGLPNWNHGETFVAANFYKIVRIKADASSGIGDHEIFDTRDTPSV